MAMGPEPRWQAWRRPPQPGKPSHDKKPAAVARRSAGLKERTRTSTDRHGLIRTEKLASSGGPCSSVWVLRGRPLWAAPLSSAPVPSPLPSSEKDPACFLPYICCESSRRGAHPVLPNFGIAKRNEVTHENDTHLAPRSDPPGSPSGGGLRCDLDLGGDPHRSVGPRPGGPRLLLRRPRLLRAMDPAPPLRLGLDAARRRPLLAPL